MVRAAVAVTIAISVTYTAHKLAVHMCALWDLSSKQELSLYVGWTLTIILLATLV